jgi:hypothetical protein
MREVTKSLVSLMSVTRIVTADSLGIGLEGGSLGQGQVRGGYGEALRWEKKSAVFETRDEADRSQRTLNKAR